MRNKLLFALIALMGLVGGSVVCGEDESLAPLQDGVAPPTFEELWAGYDPRAEPLEVETLREWEEDGVVLRVVRYRIGIFKGQKAMMAAVYGCPKGRSDLPGLVQIHGGGQYADYRAVLTNAKRGYATISISWAGRISAPGYQVNPEIVKLFWDGKTDDPDYRLTTDWGALDGYHAPCRNPGNAFAKVTPASWTLDTVESPRNNPWFLCTLAARRALTFLERQPEVDAQKLGVYGHSMGAKLTVMTAAADNRVKAAAPSCGGLSDRYSANPLYRATIGDDVNLRNIFCPIVFLSPSNDFHGRINDLPKAINEIGGQAWRVTCSPHHNHQDTAEYMIVGLLWFDQYLKGCFTFPQTPDTDLDMKTSKGVPVFTVTPDASKPIITVDIYYTQHGQKAGEKNNHENTMNRFWRHAGATRNGRAWTADLPLVSTDKPLWVYGNVLYPLNEPQLAASYYYSLYTAETFNLSSMVQMVTPEQLRAASVRATLKPSLMIETFAGDWEKEWFTYRPEDWERRTHKIYDDQWQAPPNAKLAFEVRSAQPNKLVVGVDQHAAEIQLAGSSDWQPIVLAQDDFRNATGAATLEWVGIKELRLDAKETLRSKSQGEAQSLELGANWQGTKPEFRNLRWITE